MRMKTRMTNVNDKCQWQTSMTNVNDKWEWQIRMRLLLSFVILIYIVILVNSYFIFLFFIFFYLIQKWAITGLIDKKFCKKQKKDTPRKSCWVL